MRIPDIIAKKRDGIELSREEISGIVLGYACGNVPDYQMSAFLMAAYLRGLSFDETTSLTRAMIKSGENLDLSSISGIKVDKHSTGGVGDKTTPIVVPMLAACGLKVPKMSGRGLGFTGGTLDKLESISGYSTALSIDSIISQVQNIGAAMAGQTGDIVPADKKIYALRDVTATVDSIPLIAASIMSKKIACGSDIILLDVKTGSGAFMRDLEKARELAQMMIRIGHDFGRRFGAVISDMSRPLGNAIGNAIEIREAIETLSGKGPDDLRALCIELCAVMLELAGEKNARDLCTSALDSGAALEKFREIVDMQGGDVRVIENPDLLPTAKIVQPVKSPSSGWVSGMEVSMLGEAASILGAGRERKEDSIDPAVGIIVHAKLGDRIEAGAPLASLHANDASKLAAAQALVLESFAIGDKIELPPLVREIII